MAFDGTSDAASRSSSRKESKSSTFKGNGREVISITIIKGKDKNKTSSSSMKSSQSKRTCQIDLWTENEADLNEWMFVLKQAVDNSKGRREALIKKSQALGIPAQSSQPFALASYWAEATSR